MSTRKRKRTPTPKKKCQGKCGKVKAETFFFKVDSPLFPDGRINICRDCIRDEIDVDDIEQVISFLRQIDKPFYQDEWNKALEGRDKKHPIGAYLGKINSLHQYKGKTFANSDGIDGVGNIDLSSINPPDEIKSNTGKIIKYSDELVDKWGTGYSKKEYLQLEKFYQDMMATHEIYTPTHIDMLKQLAYLSVDRDRLRRNGEWTDYSKISKTYEEMMKSAGFRPIDRKGIEDATGIRSFSQIWEEVEKRGFRKPPPTKFDEDIVDGIIIALANYYHRIVGKEILTEVPQEIKEEMEEFYKDDLTPVDINDEEYDGLDFSLNDGDDEDILLLDSDGVDNDG